MGCPPTLALFGKAVPDEQREAYYAQVDAYLKEPQPSSLDGYPSMQAAEEAKAAFSAKYPLLDGCIGVILAYIPTRERRLRLRSLLEQASALDREWFGREMPEPVLAEYERLMAEVEPLLEELEREREEWRYQEILSLLNDVPLKTREAYTAAFGPERDVQMYMAMQEGC
jgi:hypothetical protein